ncbi:MAG: copper resistance protein B, partial [Gammaproteobacteria bacterium]|nr:copper resistance protein B [Gammaproteobacteria bacterium]
MALLPVTCLAEPPVKLMDQMIYSRVSFDELELADITDADTITWRANAWFGKDQNKAGLKSRRNRNNGETENKEIQLLYSRAISAFWDLQLGYRHDFKPAPEQDWAVVTLQGLAPYFIEIEAELFYGSGGQTSLRIRAEHEAALTQRL